MGESCQLYTTFVKLMITYEFELMPFGLMNALSMFQKMLDTMLKNISFAQAQLDDVVVQSDHV